MARKQISGKPAKGLAVRKTHSPKTAPPAKRERDVKTSAAAKPRVVEQLSASTQAVARSFAAADQSASAQGVDLESRVKTIVEQWAALEAEPSGDDLLSVLWAQGHTSADFKLGATELAQQLNGSLGSTLRPSDIHTDTTVDGLVLIIE